jgi:UDP-GlcNAc:undecaprenyl-phosphate GlcNAc-1-phosphate transferase
MAPSLPAVTALAVAVLLLPLLIRWGPRLGLLDHPSPRKVHRRPTPRAGGLALYAALLLAVAVVPAADRWAVLRPLLLALPVFLLGLADDLRPLSWQFRLVVQTVAVGVAVVHGLPPVSLGLRVLAVVWVVGLLNAFNYLDNMDALSAGVAWIAAGGLVLAGAEPALFVPLMMALLGFLLFNSPPARIFLGDAGSTLLGFLIGLGSAERALAADAPPWALLFPPCLCAVPCYDTATVLLVRLWQGRHPFLADKSHLSHRLVVFGLSPGRAVAVIHIVALASGAGALLLYCVTTWAGAALVAAQMALGWSALALVELGARPSGRRD